MNNHLAQNAETPSGVSARTNGDITINQGGYLSVYISNETSGMATWFDDLEVRFTRGKLLEETHYYPYGMPVRISQDGNITENKYLYQGKEFNKTENLNLYDFHARQYDPLLGRFTSPDPLEQFYSTYVGMGNNPTNSTDPTGMWVGFNGGLDMRFGDNHWYLIHDVEDYNSWLLSWEVHATDMSTVPFIETVNFESSAGAGSESIFDLNEADAEFAALSFEDADAASSTAMARSELESMMENLGLDISSLDEYMTIEEINELKEEIEEAIDEEVESVDKIVDLRYEGALALADGEKDKLSKNQKLLLAAPAAAIDGPLPVAEFGLAIYATYLYKDEIFDGAVKLSNAIANKIDEFIVWSKGGKQYIYDHEISPLNDAALAQKLKEAIASKDNSMKKRIYTEEKRRKTRRKGKGK